MDEYKVDIRFPKQGDDSIVVITGDEDNVLDAKDHLLNLAEEYVCIMSYWNLNYDVKFALFS